MSMNYMTALLALIRDSMFIPYANPSLYIKCSFAHVCLSSNALSICLPAGGILFERLTAQTCTEYQALVMS